MGPRHAQGVVRICQWLFRTFDTGAKIRIQLPFETPAEAMRLRHPNRAVLLIEVAESSVELNREKAIDYSAALVPDYWFINLRDEEVEVYRDPVEDRSSVTGFR